MKIKPTDLIHALQDNSEIWKIILPVLLGGVMAGLAIVEFAFNEPFIFVGWSATCILSGAFAHRWWFRKVSENANEWT